VTLAGMTTRVYLERGQRKVFACAVDWPGWCRSAKDDDLALESLAAYADRYRVAADEAGVRFPKNAAAEFDVVETIKGDASTDFGVPGRVPTVDAEALTKVQAGRLADLVVASWSVFDRVAAAAPATLRKGPRGGGRDTAKIVDHVRDADHGYARQIGLKGDDATRGAVADVIRRARSGEPLAGRKWPARYAARRIAWHALDHAWEIEDRAD
jgi:hypothetical protein